MGYCILVGQIVLNRPFLYLIGRLSVHLQNPVLSFAFVHLRFKCFSSIFHWKVEAHCWLVLIKPIHVFEIFECLCSRFKFSEYFEMAWVLVLSSIDVSNFLFLLGPLHIETDLWDVRPVTAMLIVLRVLLLGWSDPQNFFSLPKRTPTWVAIVVRDG